MTDAILARWSSGTCDACGTGIARGDLIVKDHGRRWLHETCETEATDGPLADLASRAREVRDGDGAQTYPRRCGSQGGQLANGGCERTGDSCGAGAELPPWCRPRKPFPHPRGGGVGIASAAGARDRAGSPRAPASKSRMRG